jgi:hypothetical protein
MNRTHPRLRISASSPSCTSHLSPKFMTLEASSLAFSEASVEADAASEKRPNLFLCLKARTES